MLCLLLILEWGSSCVCPSSFSLVWATAYSVSIQRLVYVETLASTFILLALRPCALFSFPDLEIVLSLPLCYHTTRERNL